MVNTIYLFSFVETPRKFIIAELSIRKLGSSSVLIINLRGVSTSLTSILYDLIVNITKKHFKDLDAPVLFPTSVLLTFNKLRRNVRS